MRLRLHVARLGLNDGAKLWISFKLFSKQISSYCASLRIILSVLSRYNSVYPIAITCCINFSARKVTKKCAIWACIEISYWPNNYLLHIASTLVLEKSPKNVQNEPVSRFLIDPIATTHCINFSAIEFTKKCAKWSCIKISNWKNSY